MTYLVEFYQHVTLTFLDEILDLSSFFVGDDFPKFSLTPVIYNEWLPYQMSKCEM